MDACLYVGPDLATIAVVTEAGLVATSERHRVPLRVPALAVTRDPLS